MEGIELPPDGHLFTLAPAAVIPEDAHIYLLFDDYTQIFPGGADIYLLFDYYTQIFSIPRTRGHAFACMYIALLR